MKFLDLIIKDDKADKPQAQKPAGNDQPSGKNHPVSSEFKGITNASAPSVQQPTSVGTVDEKFLNMLEEVIENNNMPGIDYFEFKQGLDKMKSIPIDEASKFVSVFSILESQGCKKDYLLSSIDKYVELINAEQPTFANELANQFKERVEDKKKAAQDATTEIEQLKQRIIDLNQLSMTNMQEAQQAEMELKMSELNFNKSLNSIITMLNSDKEKILNFIP